MIVLTGAAGFIGSCLVARLNELGHENLILVDHFDDDQDPKHENLKNKTYQKYYDKKDFLNNVYQNSLPDGITCILHMGACSSTTCQDKQYFQLNNFEYTKKLAQWSLAHKIRFIYASSAATYGDGSNGYSDDDATTMTCKPLNLYGESKQIFDELAIGNGWTEKMVGLKFFNVFGPNEYHKGDMRSVVSKAFQKVMDEGKMSLFKSYHPDYKDGEQKRDFIYVKDVVEVVMFFMNHPKINGIFNVGTGQARTWNDLATSLFKACSKNVDIDYVEMPEILRDKYQYFTQAEMRKLKKAGYKQPFTSLEDAVEDYVGYLKNHSFW